MKRRSDEGRSVSFVAGCLCASVVLCVIDGAIRKWVYQDGTPSFQAITYFAKDAPLVAAFLYLLGRGEAGRSEQLRSCLIVGTFAIAAGCAVKLQAYSPVGAVVSLRGLLFLPWFAYVVGPHCNCRWDLHAVGIAIGASAILNAFLGASQFALPLDHVLNQQSSSAVTAVGDVGRIRASGTFAYISGMAAMCIGACWVGAALILRNRASALGYACIVAGLVCTSAAVSRSGALVGLLLVVFPLLLINSGRVLLIALVATIVALYGFVGGVVGEVNTEEASLQTAVAARVQTADSFDERSSGTFSQVPDAIGNYPLGVGLGRAQASAAAVSEQDAIYEYEPARIAYEIGLLGLLGTAIIRAGFIWEFWRARRRGGDAACTATGLTFSGLALVITIVFDHNTATFWAVAMTVCLGARRIERGR